MTSERSTVIGIPNDRKQRHALSVLSYACITTATNNFSAENKLGEGGFGSVYMVSSNKFLKKDVLIRLYLILAKSLI